MTCLKVRTWVYELFAILTLIYVPFLGTRFIRTAGDEKVYISQAVEMARDGHWFIQSLQDVPDYYKGPLHYLFLRVGQIVFGLNAWALLYMNFILIFLGAWALGSIVEKHLPEWKGGALFSACFFALGFGVYAHMFASQMEIELTAIFTCALWLLDRMKPQSAGWAFWALAGIIGWVKAPLHSVFLGVSAILFWLLTGQLGAKVKNWKAWAAALCGVAICCAGYAPAFFLDRENFISRFIQKEILLKTSTQQGWSVTVTSVFGFYLMPWMMVAFVSYLLGMLKLPSLLKNPPHRRLLALGLCAAIPSVSFFLWNEYRFEPYNLPVIGGILLVILTFWHSTWHNILYRVAFSLTGLVVLIFPVAVTVLGAHFAPLPAWWPAWLIPFLWIGSLPAAALIFWFGVFKKGENLRPLAWSLVGLFAALGAFFMVLGEREMFDLRAALLEAEAQGQKPRLTYYNLDGNVWSEWGLLNFSLHTPVRGAHRPETLKAAFNAGDWILVPTRVIGDFKKYLENTFPALSISDIEIRPWNRWKTHGQSESGAPLWKDAWDKRDLSILQQQFWIVHLRQRIITHSGRIPALIPSLNCTMMGPPLRQPKAVAARYSYAENNRLAP